MVAVVRRVQCVPVGGVSWRVNRQFRHRLNLQGMGQRRAVLPQWLDQARHGLARANGLDLAVNQAQFDA